MKKLPFTQMMVGRVAVILLPFGAAAQGLHIGTGSHMVINGSPVLVINNGGLINDGSFAAGGSTVQLTGTSAAAISSIGGASPLAFNNLAISKTSGDVQMNRNLTLGQELIMSGGNLQLNRHALDMGTTGLIVNESEQSHIAGLGAGQVLAKANLEANSPVALDPGNIGLLLTSDVDGSFIVVRMNTVEKLPGGGKGISRNFTIAGPAGAHVTYGFRYLNAELNGNLAYNLVIYATDRAGAVLTSIGRTRIDTVSKIITKTDTALFGHITAGAGTVTSANGAVNKSSVQANAAVLQANGMNGSAMAKAYPNPAHDQVTIDLVSLKEGPMVVGLYDQSGHLMQQKRINAVVGKNTFTWDLGKYPAGIYYVTPEGQGVQNVKIIKD